MGGHRSGGNTRSSPGGCDAEEAPWEGLPGLRTPESTSTAPAAGSPAPVVQREGQTAEARSTHTRRSERHTGPPARASRSQGATRTSRGQNSSSRGPTNYPSLHSLPRGFFVFFSTKNADDAVSRKSVPDTSPWLQQSRPKAKPGPVHVTPAIPNFAVHQAGYHNNPGLPPPTPPFPLPQGDEYENFCGDAPEISPDSRTTRGVGGTTRCGTAQRRATLLLPDHLALLTRFHVAPPYPPSPVKQSPNASSITLPSPNRPGVTREATRTDGPKEAR